MCVHVLVCVHVCTYVCVTDTCPGMLVMNEIASLANDAAAGA